MDVLPDEQDKLAYSPVLRSSGGYDDLALDSVQVYTVEFDSAEEEAGVLGEDKDNDSDNNDNDGDDEDHASRIRGHSNKGLVPHQFSHPPRSTLRRWLGRWGTVATVVGFAAVGGFLFGYDTGVIGGAILLIREQFHLTDVLVEAVVSVALVGAIFGSAVGGPLADSLGRRLVMGGASCLFVLGSLVMAAAPGVSALLVGRFIVGLAIGVAAIVSPVYLAEISPARSRGAVVTVNNLCLTGGQFLSYILDSALISAPGGWRWMLGLGAVPAAVQLLGVAWWLPESPRWLIGRYMAVRDDAYGLEPGLVSLHDAADDEGMEWRERLDRAEWDRQQARAILRRLRGEGDPRACYDDDNDEAGLAEDDEVEREVKEIEASLEQQTQTTLAQKWAILRTGPVRSALVVGLGLQLFQQFCGINTAMYYSPTILKMAGFESDASAIWFADLVAFANALFTGLALLLMDRAGRRTLLLVSLSGVIGALFLLGVAFVDGRGDRMGYMAVASLVLFVGFFALGMGPIPWVVNSEIYPAEVRGLANGLAATVNWSANLLVSMTFLSYIDLVGTTAVFWTFAGVGLVAWFFVYWKLPETKGLAIEQIQGLFAARSAGGGNRPSGGEDEGEEEKEKFHLPARRTQVM